MEIQKIEESNHSEYWDFISGDTASNFFEIYEFTNNFASTNFWMAKHAGQIVGSMYFNKSGTLRLLGNNDVIAEFMKIIDFTPKYLNLPSSASNLIPVCVVDFKKRLNMIRLTKQKIGLLGKPAHICIKLTKNQMKNALNVFKAAEPEDWENSNPEDHPFDKKNVCANL